MSAPTGSGNDQEWVIRACVLRYPGAAITRAYVNADDDDVPAFNVFTRRDGTLRHFWAGEMGAESADPGQDPRGAPDLMPLWTILDSTPEGRGTDWYPQLDYPK